jgi:outer membrane protein TolC
MNKTPKLLNTLTMHLLLVFVVAGIEPAHGQPAEAEVKFYANHPLLEQFVGEALLNNPALQEAIARYRASLQKTAQVTSLPDPTFKFTQFIRTVETRVGPQWNVFSLSQKLPWFGKLDRKGQVALRESAALYQMYRAEERQVIAQVKRTFYELGYIDRALEITREEESLLDHYERLSQARYSLGQGLMQAVIKVQAEITQVIDRSKLLERQRESLVARLNTLMDRPPEQMIPGVQPISLPEVPLNLEQLYDLGERNRQELKAVLARIEKEERTIELAKKDYWPDVTVSAGWINVAGRGDLAGILLPPPDNGKDAFNFSVGINLPIWRDKYHAGVVEATEKSIAERRNYLKTRNEMEFSIRDQVVRIQTLADQMDLYEEVLIPQAEGALRSSESAYETTQLGILELLDSERFLLRSRLVMARYNADYLRALTDLERAVGTKFPN